MSVKLTNQIVEDISVFEMKDGQIAVITNWGGSSYYNGKVIQRYGSSLITIGMDCRNGWPMLYNGLPDSAYRVRLLKPGEAITIVEN